MTAQLLKSKEAGAEAVLTYGIGPELAQIANGMAKLGWKVPIIGSWTLSMANYIDNSGANGEARACRRPSSRTRTRPSARHSSTPIWPSSSPRTTASTRRCRRQGYDSIFLLAAAIKQATPPTARRSAKLENLQTPVEGVVMTYNKPFSHDNHDAITAKEVVIGEVRAGAWSARESTPKRLRRFFLAERRCGRASSRARPRIREAGSAWSRLLASWGVRGWRTAYFGSV